jgi:hypothetical protein
MRKLQEVSGIYLERNWQRLLIYFFIFLFEADAVLNLNDE